MFAMRFDFQMLDLITEKYCIPANISVHDIIAKLQCFPRVPTAGQNGQLLGLYWPTTLVEDIKSYYLEVKASKSDKRS